jgi:hypothetical protein
MQPIPHTEAADVLAAAARRELPGHKPGRGLLRTPDGSWRVKLR